jgi:hypothetical protein
MAGQAHVWPVSLDQTVYLVAAEARAVGAFDFERPAPVGNLGEGDSAAGAHDPLAWRLALAALSLAKIWRNCRTRSDSGIGSPSIRPASKVISAARSESVSSTATISQN